MSTSVSITYCTDPTGLYHRYPGREGQQPAYIEIDTVEGTLGADWDSEVGEPRAVPDAVAHGLTLRFRIPTLTAEAVNRVLDEIAPAAGRVVSGTTKEWAGKRAQGRMDDDARAAHAEIVAALSRIEHLPTVQEWDADSVTTGVEAEEYGITVATSDARLREIAAEIRQQVAEEAPSSGSEAPVIVVHDLMEYLEELRRTAES